MLQSIGLQESNTTETLNNNKDKAKWKARGLKRRDGTRSCGAEARIEVETRLRRGGLSIDTCPREKRKRTLGAPLWHVHPAPLIGKACFG